MRARGGQGVPRERARPTFLREVRGPLPQIPLIPTGGVMADSARPLLDAGAVAIGIGSWLTGSTDRNEVLARARQLRSAIDRP